MVINYHSILKKELAIYNPNLIFLSNPPDLWTKAFFLFK